MATFSEALNYARQLLASGQFAGAEPVYRQLLAAAPQAAELWHEMGLLRLQTGALEEARQCLSRAVELDGNVAAYHSNLGAVYRKMKRPAEAAACFRRAVSIASPTPEIYNNLALALKDSDQEDEALATFDAALALREDYANGHFNRANLLYDIGRIDEAVAGYRRVLQLAPRDAAAWGRLGAAYYDQADTDAALDCFGRALAIQPDFPEARRSRGVIWLARGEYDRGWAEAEYRLECKDSAPRAFTKPRWRGEPLAGRTLLLHPEQGLGDTLQFMRYAPLALQCGGAVKLAVQPPLVPLARQSGFEAGLVSADEPADFDVHCPLMSVPAYLPDASGQPYWGGPYLRAKPELVADWQPRIAALGGFKVGIAWAGNPTHAADRFRSVHLRQFAPLAAIDGVRLVSLQCGQGKTQIAEVGGEFDVVDLGDDVDRSAGAFMDTAAVIEHLDLVVSVDTSIVHLAGGLGQAAWVLVPFSPDWRWGLTGDTTRWYPSLRLFRQRRFDVWVEVFAQVAAALRPLVAERRDRKH